MLRIHAYRVVALMQNIKIVWKLSMFYTIKKSVSTMPFTTQLNPAVTAPKVKERAFP